MHPHAPCPLVHTPWQAQLNLRFSARDGRSVLSENSHQGPLRVQKALYPEGDAVCQVLLLHPPAGIAGGDQLAINVAVESASHAQITTPGAGKWYRSAGPLATQNIQLKIAENAALEWLPQEVIVFDGVEAQTNLTISLAPSALCIGQDILCLGRQARGEQFLQGNFRQRIRVQKLDGRPLWQEQMHLSGGGLALNSPVALHHHPVSGTFWLAGIGAKADLLDALRAVAPHHVAAGITALPAVTLIRAVAQHSEAVRDYFAEIWAVARLHLLQRPAVPPRIWRT